jgi:hypothetical protein
MGTKLTFSQIPSPLQGVPILFIPGNAGTYKQVRSFGAEMHKIIGGEYSNLKDVTTVFNIFALFYFKFKFNFKSNFNLFHISNKNQCIVNSLQFRVTNKQMHMIFLLFTFKRNFLLWREM